MAFVPYGSGDFSTKKVKMTGSVTSVKGAVARYDAGVGTAENGAAASAAIYGVWATSVTSGSSGDYYNLIIPFRDGQEWLVDTAGTAALTQVGTIVSLEDVSTLDENDTANTPLFKIIKFVDTAHHVVQPEIANFTAISA
jgi:hypothetical protein